MKSVYRNAFPLAVLVAISAMLPASCARPAQAQQTSTPTEPISVVDVVNRIHRYGRMSPDNAELILGSGDASSDSAMRLELALLLVYGPEPVRDRQRGLRVLEGLVRDHDPVLIPGPTVRMIEALIPTLREIVALEADLDATMLALEQERRARQSADETLEALRQIEQELEAIKGNNSGDEGDGQNGH